MKLFVANLSKHNQEFLWNLHERIKTNVTYIPIGQQRQIGGDLSQPEVDHIVKHHERYGMRPAKEIKNLRAYAALCYSIDEPVDLDRFHEGYERNDAELEARSEELRAETAAVIASQASDVIGEPMKRVETEIFEKTDGETPRIAAGVEVVGEGETPRHEGRRRVRGRP